MSAGRRHQSGGRLDHVVVGGLVAARSILTKGRDRAVNQSRVDLAHHVIAEAERGECSGPVILDHHVRTLDEPFQDGTAGLALQVQGDRSLVGALGQVAGPHAASIERPIGAAIARLVGILGMLDLDDVGA
jgi:hypothetical protein